MVDKLFEKFNFYNNDIKFYQSIADKFSDFDSAFGYIVDLINKDIKSGNINFFIKGINSSNILEKITELLTLLGDLNIELDINDIANLIKKSPELDLMLNKLFKTLEYVSEDDINKITNNEYVKDFLITYAIIKDIYDIDLSMDECAIKSDVTSDHVRDYIHQIMQIPMMPYEQIIENYRRQEELKKQIALGRDILKNTEKLNYLRNLVVNANLRLVVSIAKRFRYLGLEFMDLINEGNIGLMKAAEKYNYKSENQFGTYATWWIRQAIGLSLSKTGNTIVLPRDVSGKIANINRIKRKLALELNKEPTNADIAIYLDVDEKEINEFLDYAQVVTSLDVKVGEDESATLGEFLESNINLEEDFINDVTQNILNDELRALGSDLEFIIRARFGINDPKNPKKEFERNHTLDEVSKMFNVTRERIRQKEAKALRKLSLNPNLRSIANISSEVTSFWDFFPGVNKEKIFKNIKRLSYDYKFALFQMFGYDLDIYNVVKRETRKQGEKAIKLLQKMLESPRNKSVYTLQEKLKGSSKDIELLAQDLQNDSEKAILFQVFGTDLSEIIDEDELDVDVKNKLNILYESLRVNTKMVVPSLYLKEILEATDAEIEFLNKNEDKTTKKYQLLSKIYGLNYNEIHYYEFKDREEYHSYYIYINYLKKQLNSYRIKHKSIDYIHLVDRPLTDILNVSREEITNLINIINIRTKQYICLSKIFGNALLKEDVHYLIKDYPELSLYYNSLFHFRNLILSYRDNISLLDECINSLPVQYRLIISLYLGVIDNIRYDCEDIAIMLNQDEEDVNNKLKMGIYLIEVILEKVKDKSKEKVKVLNLIRGE